MLVRYFFLMWIVFVVANPAHADSADVLKLIASRDFWSSYRWEVYEDSELYKAAVWTQNGKGGYGRNGQEIWTTEDFVTPFKLDGLNIGTLAITVDISTKVVSSIWTSSINVIDGGDYDKLVSWCKDKLGDSPVERESTDGSGDHVRHTIRATWDLGKTIVEVRRENNRSNGPKSVGFITTLTFRRGYPKKVQIINEVKPKTVPIEAATEPALKPSHPIRGESAPALRIVPVVRKAANRDSTPEPAEKPEKHPGYLPSPYIWDDEAGITHATNDLQEVPENIRGRFKAPE